MDCTCCRAVSHILAPFFTIQHFLSHIFIFDRKCQLAPVMCLAKSRNACVVVFRSNLKQFKVRARYNIINLVGSIRMHSFVGLESVHNYNA